MRLFIHILTYFSCCTLFCSALVSEDAQKVFSDFSCHTLDFRVWKEEYFLAQKFLEQRDYFSAIASLKRSKILCPSSDQQGHQKIDRSLIEVYFNLQDYSKVIRTFTLSTLNENIEFAREGISTLVCVYKSYEKLKEYKQADRILAYIQTLNPASAQPLLLAQAFTREEGSYASHWGDDSLHSTYLIEGLMPYKKALKSKQMAKWLSVVIPGAGYWYAGRAKSGVTSFLVNGLLIAASMQCFVARFYALGILTATFEMGWYFGGIMGAVKAVRQHNEELFLKLESQLQQFNFGGQNQNALD